MSGCKPNVAIMVPPEKAESGGFGSWSKEGVEVGFPIFVLDALARGFREPLLSPQFLYLHYITNWLALWHQLIQLLFGFYFFKNYFQPHIPYIILFQVNPIFSYFWTTYSPKKIISKHIFPQILGAPLAKLKTYTTSLKVVKSNTLLYVWVITELNWGNVL